MAFLGTNRYAEEEEARAKTSSSPGAKAAIDYKQPGAGAGAGFAGSGPAPSRAPGAAPGGGQRFANLSQYLAANQSTGAKTGQAAAGVVRGAADAAANATGAFKDSAAGEIDAAWKGGATDDATMEKIRGGASKIEKSVEDAINAGAHTAPMVVNGGPLKGTLRPADYSGPSNFDQYKYKGPMEAYSAGWAGPVDANDWSDPTYQLQQDALGKTQQAREFASLAQGKEGGAAALLERAYTQPKYTGGEKTLDSFLATGTRGGQSALAGAANASGLSAYDSTLGDLSKSIDYYDDTPGNANASYQRAIQKGMTDSDAVISHYRALAEKAMERTRAAQAAWDAANSGGGGTGGQQGGSGENSGFPPPTATETAPPEAVPPWVLNGDNPPQTDTPRDQPDPNAETSITNGFGYTPSTDEVTPPGSGSGQPKSLPELGTAALNVVKPVASDVQNVVKSGLAAPTKTSADITGAVGGSQGSKNSLLTTYLTGGGSALAPDATKATTAAAKKAARDAKLESIRLARKAEEAAKSKARLAEKAATKGVRDATSALQLKNLQTGAASQSVREAAINAANNAQVAANRAAITAKGLGGDLSQGFKDAVGNVGGQLSAAGKSVENAIRRGSDYIGDTWDNVTENAGDAVSGVLGDGIDGLQNFGNNANAALDDAGEFVSQNFSKLRGMLGRR